MRLIETKEGKIRLLIPDPSEYSKGGRFDPSWAPVFYNPKMVMNRDISVLVNSVIKPKIVIDALSATGVRGIRYYVEVGGINELIMNDIDPIAVELIKKNMELNGVTGKVFNRDANSLLNELKGDFIDIDPFGSPSKFLLSAFNSSIKGGYVAITATDLSALVCSSKTSARRKYDIICEKLSFSKELGIRGLISKAIREASIIEKAPVPIFAYYHEYYYRVFFKINRGAKKADHLLSKLKYFYECPSCGYRDKNDYLEERKCPRCGSKLRVYGPAYDGPIYDKELLIQIRDKLKEFNYFQSLVSINKLLDKIYMESEISEPFYKLDFISSRLKVNTPKRDKVIECLGGKAYLTHFDEVGIKTNFSLDEVKECIKKVSTTSTNIR
jgi:tRNA (guanine26-N2/guanine27-N2)-dimethyltransferase